MEYGRIIRQRDSSLERGRYSDTGTVDYFKLFPIGRTDIVRLIVISTAGPQRPKAPRPMLRPNTGLETTPSNDTSNGEKTESGAQPVTRNRYGRRCRSKKKKRFRLSTG